MTKMKKGKHFALRPLPAHPPPVAHLHYRYYIIIALSNNMDSFMNTDVGGDKLPVVIACFVFLGIERLLYGYCYHFTAHFKKSVRRGSFGPKIQAEPLYWRCMMELGKWIKVFQFSIFIFDWIVRKNVSNDLLTPADWSAERTTRFGIGLFLVLLGQFLNVAVFRALTPKGVYYGYEFGYPMERVTCFPYNTNWISDPQYWGVVICVWGAYIGLGSTIYTVPVLETFWYIMSMQVFEHSRGEAAIKRVKSFSGSIHGVSASANPQSPVTSNEKDD